MTPGTRSFLPNVRTYFIAHVDIPLQCPVTNALSNDHGPCFTSLHLYLNGASRLADTLLPQLTNTKISKILRLHWPPAVVMGVGKLGEKNPSTNLTPQGVVINTLLEMPGHSLGIGVVDEYGWV